MMYPLVVDLAAEGVRVSTTCRVLGFSTQAFYKWRARPWSDSEWDDAHLVNELVDLHADDPEFGYRFLHDELVAAGHGVSANRVHRLCRQNRVWSVFAKKRGLGRKAGPPVHDDLVKRHFKAEQPDQVWLCDIERHEALSNRAVVKGHSCWSVAADWFEVEGSPIPGTWVRVASSPDKAGTHQHCQMVSGPANETGRCNDSEPAYERLSRENHQLEPNRSGLGCGAHPRERGTLWPVDVAGREATVNACGVAVARPQGHSWAPHLSNGLRVNVGTGQLVPSPARHQRVDGKACRRLMPTGRGGGVVVVRGRESRSHGEGPQCVRSIHADQGGRW